MGQKLNCLVILIITLYPCTCTYSWAATVTCMVIYPLLPIIGEYHKYDTIVYPQKTQVRREKLSDKISGFINIFRSKKSDDSKEEEELIPMEFYDMSVFCLHCYLGEYKDMVCKGRFQQGANIILDAKRVVHIFFSLLSFNLYTISILGYDLVEVPNPNKYREVGSQFD